MNQTPKILLMNRLIIFTSFIFLFFVACESEEEMILQTNELESSSIFTENVATAFNSNCPKLKFFLFSDITTSFDCVYPDPPRKLDFLIDVGNTISSINYTINFFIEFEFFNCWISNYPENTYYLYEPCDLVPTYDRVYFSEPNFVNTRHIVTSTDGFWVGNPEAFYTINVDDLGKRWRYRIGYNATNLLLGFSCNDEYLTDWNLVESTNCREFILE